MSRSPLDFQDFEKTFLFLLSFPEIFILKLYFSSQFSRFCRTISKTKSTDGYRDETFHMSPKNGAYMGVAQKQTDLLATNWAWGLSMKLPCNTANVKRENVSGHA